MGLEATGLKIGKEPLKKLVDEGITAARPYLDKAKSTFADLAGEVKDQLSLSTRASEQAAQVGPLKKLAELPGKLIESLRAQWNKLLSKGMQSLPKELLEEPITRFTGQISQVYDDAAKQVLSKADYKAFQTLRQQQIKGAAFAKPSQEFKDLSAKVQQFVDGSPALSKKAYRLGDQLGGILNARPDVADLPGVQQALRNLV